MPEASILVYLLWYVQHSWHKILLVASVGSHVKR